MTNNLKEIESKIRDYVQSAYFHGLPVENLDTGEVESPKKLGETEWIVERILALINQKEKEAEIAGLEMIYERARKTYQLEKVMSTAETRIKQLKEELNKEIV